MKSLSQLADEFDKEAAKPPEKSMGLRGNLYVSASGWLMLDVKNGLVRALQSTLGEPGTELPYHTDGKLQAHISVMRPEEVKLIGGSSRITERGKSFHYTLAGVETVKPSNWAGVSQVWYVKVNSPELKALRRSYGLSDLPNKNKYSFHITFAVRKKGVLAPGPVSKAASSSSDAFDSVVRQLDVFDGVRVWLKEVKERPGKPDVWLDFQDWAEGDTVKFLSKRFESAYGKDRVHYSNEQSPPLQEGWQELRIGSDFKLKELRDAEKVAESIAPNDDAHDRDDKPFTVAVDLDGTLAGDTEKFDPDIIGPPFSERIECINQLHDAGARIIIYTVRGNSGLVARWCRTNKVKFDYVNENPDQPADASGKIIADMYLDDRAWNIRHLAQAMPVMLQAIKIRKENLGKTEEYDASEEFDDG